MLHYATLGAREKVAMLCVGSELVTTETNRSRWADLIRKVRRVYPGTLVYSANWDHYTPVTFWDLVDVVGLTAYYQLTRDKQAPEKEMVASWRAVRQKLANWSARRLVVQCRCHRQRRQIPIPIQ